MIHNALKTVILLHFWEYCSVCVNMWKKCGILDFSYYFICFLFSWVVAHLHTGLLLWRLQCECVDRAFFFFLYILFELESLQNELIWPQDSSTGLMVTCKHYISIERNILAKKSRISVKRDYVVVIFQIFGLVCFLII